MSVAAFYRRFMAELAAIDIAASRSTCVPNEVADPIPFPDDETHAAYDPAAVHALWRALVQVDRVFRHFRTGFLGKASPVHLFWGAFDLAVTRFSGRPAPLHPGGIPGLPDAVTREAYSHEVSSAGFWPGSDAYPQAAFYSYAYPAPAGFEAARSRARRRRLVDGDGRMAAALRGGAPRRRPRRRPAARSCRRPIAPPPTSGAGTRRSSARSASPAGRARFDRP